MRKAIIAAALLAATPALADWHGPRYEQHNHYYRGGGGGGGDVGMAIFGGLVGGMILNQMMQPPRQQYYYEPQCQTVFMGRVWNGYAWVEQYQRVCQ